MSEQGFHPVGCPGCLAVDGLCGRGAGGALRVCSLTTDKKVGGLIALSAQPSARLTALLVSPDSSVGGGGGFAPVLMLSGTAALSVANLAVQDGEASGSDQMRSAIH